MSGWHCDWSRVVGRLTRYCLALVVVAGACLNRIPGARAGGGSGYGLNGIALLVRTEDPQLDLAERYALAVLGADFDGTVHAAAADYYSNPWIRDSFAWAALPTLRDASVSSYVTTELAYWLPKQQPFGGWLTAPKSGYFDETPILIASVLNAYQVTGDLGMVREALPRLERGWQWLRQSYVQPEHGSGYLLYANVPPHVAADWVDQIARRGYATELEALWYWSTHSMAIMEQLTGHAIESAQYGSFASHIRTDINRLLWTTSPPYVYDAAPVPGFGHYRSWQGPREYFELDSNFLCVLYGIADPSQAQSILGFVRRHGTYLLGLRTTSGVPAKVVYGDYAPADYALKHERLAPGKYQNGYWTTVGSLAAIAYARIGDTTESRAILTRIGAAFIRDGDVREWYTQSGAGSGAPAFQWSARMFVAALYAAYLGIDDYSSQTGSHVESGIRVRLPDGGGSADVAFHGRIVHIAVAGSGAAPRVTLNGKRQPGETIPGALICAGCTLEARWGPTA